MRALSRLLSVFLILAVLLGGGLSSGSAPAQADFQAFEAVTKFNGAPYEINLDNEGNLWVSDCDIEEYISGEIWRVDPASNTFQKYPVGGCPSDARRVGNFLYWVDDIKIARSNLSGDYFKWSVDNAIELYGTAVDANGAMWVVELNSPHIYRLDPDPIDPIKNEYLLCKYTIPEISNLSGYLYWYSTGGKEYLLFGADWPHRLLHFNLTDGLLEWWQISNSTGNILGLTVDAQNHLWYADQNEDAINMLVSGSDELTQYHLPVNTNPAMIAFQGDLLWFTVADLPRLGVLDPYTAAETSRVLVSSRWHEQPEPKCENVSPEGPYSISVSDSAPLTLTGAKYPAFYEAGGWYMYLMPQGADPWGITLVDGKVWVVDQDRQVLAQTWLQASLRACKKWDLDKDAGTSGDQYPVPGWRMDLYKDNSLVDSKLTGADGCAQWDGLELPATYKVGEETRPDWELIDWPGCDPTEITLPGTHTCTFVNWTEVHPVFLPLIQR